MSNVLHFIRKDSQLRASFINNQISSHIHFKPVIGFHEKRTDPFEGGFAEFNIRAYPCLDLSIRESKSEKIRYRILRRISNRQIKQILEFIKKNEVKVCHFHYGTDCGVYAPLLKHITIPSVVSFYGYDCSSFPNLYFGYGKIFLKNRVFKPATKILAMSPDMKKDLVAAGCPEDKIEVHYYGTDVHRFYLSEKQFDDKNPVIILNLCSLVPQKGQQFLLKSIALLVAKGITNFRLRIVGTGELEQQLKAFVEDNNLSSYVSFIGAIPYGRIEMISEYNSADLFVHPSVVAPNGDKEGIPGTIVEAMSAALPVVSTYHAGIPYIIKDNETGFLVKEHDVESLSNVLIELIKNADLRKKTGLAGQHFAMENLDLMKKEIELEEIYQRMIDRV